jgi:hypothetical protein
MCQIIIGVQWGSRDRTAAHIMNCRTAVVCRPHASKVRLAGPDDVEHSGSSPVNRRSAVAQRSCHVQLRYFYEKAGVPGKLGSVWNGDEPIGGGGNNDE